MSGFVLGLSLFLFVSCVSASTPPAKDLPKINTSAEKPQPAIIIGNKRTSLYLPKLKGKKVGLVGNQTSVIGKTHLVDSLLALKVNMVAVYSPEHGFRGDADAGETIKNGKDAKTGLPIYSLYGNNKKP
ncbi:MAG TPA: DUF1343 domain-containing protein, partial [Crocinitomicaceae bacterium]|nr:DUF1343 domain-containing protein [Crocinitomicaceae bacterium]